MAEQKTTVSWEGDSASYAEMAHNPLTADRNIRMEDTEVPTTADLVLAFDGLTEWEKRQVMRFLKQRECLDNIAWLKRHYTEH